MSYVLPLAALALSATAAAASTVDLGINLDDTDSLSNLTVHGELFSAFDFGNGVTGTVSVINGFGTNAQTGEARIFDTRATGTADDDLEGDFTNVNDAGDVRDFGKALVIQERVGVASAIPDDERRGGIVTFAFDNAVDILGLAYLDGERGAIVKADGIQIGDFGQNVSGDHMFVDLDFSNNNNALGINTLTVQYNGSGAIGGLDFQTAAVPLPAGLPLLLVGLGGLALLRRTHKKG